MKAALFQYRYYIFDGLKCGANIGSALGGASVVETKNGAVRCVLKEQARNARRGPSPVAGEDGPHDAHKVQALLRGFQSKPADAVGSAKEPRDNAGGLAYGFLGERELAVNKFGRMEIEPGMRIGMVAD